MSELTIIYNSQGCGAGKLEFRNDLLKESDLLLVQEHWLSESQLILFKQKLFNVNSYAVTGMDSNVLHHGRPYGGLAIIWNQTLDATIEPIHCSSKIICAIKLKTEMYSVLICNIYMPTKYCPQLNYLTEFNEVIAELSIVVNMSQCTHVIVGGYFNTNFQLGGKNVEALQLFMHNYSLSCGLENSASQ